MQFTERAQSELWHWTVILDQSLENEPPPEWVMRPTKLVTGEDQRLVGSSAPEIRGRALDGTSYALSDLRGKLVVLDFWATHCGYCSEQMSEFEQIRQDLAGIGVEVVGVNEESAEVVSRWHTQRKHRLPVILVAPGTAFKAYHVESLPSTVVVDREGNVARQWIEFVSGSKVSQALKGLIAPPR